MIEEKEARKCTDFLVLVRDTVSDAEFDVKSAIESDCSSLLLVLASEKLKHDAVSLVRAADEIRSIANKLKSEATDAASTNRTPA